MRRVKTWLLILLGLAAAGAVHGRERQGGDQFLAGADISYVRRARPIENRKQLLAEVNIALRQRHHRLMSLDELIVCVGEEANYQWDNQDLPPLVQSFLQCLVNGRKFPHPVELWASHADWIRVAGNADQPKSLFVPMHYTIEVHLRALPLGAKDRQGNDLKVGWDTIVVAHGLGE
jgi:hypothetical protein